MIGTDDRLVINGWYSGQSSIEQFRTADGKTLLDSSVQNLVQAMASFAPPAPDETQLPSGYVSSLGGVIAANWQ